MRVTVGATTFEYEDAILELEAQLVYSHLLRGLVPYKWFVDRLSQSCQLSNPLSLHSPPYLPISADRIPTLTTSHEQRHKISDRSGRFFENALRLIFQSTRTQQRRPPL